MDKERIKGKAQDIAGRAERQVGEWTGNEKLRLRVWENRPKARSAMLSAKRKTPCVTPPTS